MVVHTEGKTTAEQKQETGEVGRNITNSVLSFVCVHHDWITGAELSSLVHVIGLKRRTVRQGVIFLI